MIYEYMDIREKEDYKDLCTLLNKPGYKDNPVLIEIKEELKRLVVHRIKYNLDPGDIDRELITAQNRRNRINYFKGARE